MSFTLHNRQIAAPSRDGAARRGKSGGAYIAEVFDGADDALAALEAVEGDVASTGFQSLDWLTVLFEELAPSKRAAPRLVVVSDQSTGEVAIALPLLIERRRLSVGRFPDLGVCDYGAPILGPASPDDRATARRLWRAVRSALRDLDVVHLQCMPAKIGQRQNPLLLAGRTSSAGCFGHTLAIDGEVDDFLASQGQTFCEDYDRCADLLKKAGETHFHWAQTPEAIARIFSALEDQQAARDADSDAGHAFNRAEYRAFYERLAMDGTASGLCRLFAIEVEGEVVAALLGIVHNDTFTPLRMSSASGKWNDRLLARLMFIEAARRLRAAGVTRFDMGISAYPLDAGCGLAETPLYDFIAAPRLAGQPFAAWLRLRPHLPRIGLNRELPDTAVRRDPAAV